MDYDERQKLKASLIAEGIHPEFAGQSIWKNPIAASEPFPASINTAAIRGQIDVLIRHLDLPPSNAKNELSDELLEACHSRFPVSRGNGRYDIPYAVTTLMIEARGHRGYIGEIRLERRPLDMAVRDVGNPEGYVEKQVLQILGHSSVGLPVPRDTVGVSYRDPEEEKEHQEMMRSLDYGFGKAFARSLWQKLGKVPGAPTWEAASLMQQRPLIDIGRGLMGYIRHLAGPQFPVAARLLGINSILVDWKSPEDTSPARRGNPDDQMPDPRRGYKSWLEDRNLKLALHRLPYSVGRLNSVGKDPVTNFAKDLSSLRQLVQNEGMKSLAVFCGLAGSNEEMTPLRERALSAGIFFEKSAFGKALKRWEDQGVRALDASLRRGKEEGARYLAHNWISSVAGGVNLTESPQNSDSQYLRRMAMICEDRAGFGHSGTHPMSLLRQIDDAVSSHPNCTEIIDRAARDDGFASDLYNQVVGKSRDTIRWLDLQETVGPELSGEMIRAGLRFGTVMEAILQSRPWIGAALVRGHVDSTDTAMLMTEVVEDIAKRLSMDEAAISERLYAGLSPDHTDHDINIAWRAAANEISRPGTAASGDEIVIAFATSLRIRSSAAIDFVLFEEPEMALTEEVTDMPGL